MKHIPVLLDAVLETLGDVGGMRIIDATFGAGGYSQAFLSRGATVVAFDRDPNVHDDAARMQDVFGNRFTFVGKTFSHINELDNRFDAIVFDFGISSMQIDTPERGFSFRSDGPLDMRMDSNANTPTAGDLIKQISVDELAMVLRDYGNVSKARVLARAIKDALPTTTFQLRDLIYVPRDIAPVFQALRIAVNDEFGEIRRALNVVPDLLKPHGKCICVTFHSIEDRIVKNQFRDWTMPPGNPRIPTNVSSPFILMHTRTPSQDEVAANPRARSAHMRAVEKSY